MRGSVRTGMLFVAISTGGFAMQYIHLPSGLRQYRTIKAAAIWPRQVKFAKAANCNIRLSISSVRISLVKARLGGLWGADEKLDKAEAARRK